MKVTLKGLIDGVEIAAKDALAFLTKETVKAVKNGPKAVAALGVLVEAVEQFLADGDTGQLVAAIELIKPIWNDVKAFLETLGIKVS